MKTLDKEFLMTQIFSVLSSQFSVLSSQFSVLRLVFCQHSKISSHTHTNFLKKQRSLCGIFLQGFALFLLCQKVSHKYL